MCEHTGTVPLETFMTNYLIIESRDPYESSAVREHLDLAVQLRAKRHDVGIYLVQNGVLPARTGAVCPEINAALAAGVEVLADDFSLSERGIQTTVKGVRAVSIELVIDR